MMTKALLLTLAFVGSSHAYAALGFQGGAAAPGYNYGAPGLQGAASAPASAYGVPDLDVAPSTIEEIRANPNHPISILASSIGGGDGVPGVDFPILDSVPETTFSCEEQDYPGYYADEEAGCQVFHICQFDGRHDSFLCPNGTVFNQQYFVCDFWSNVDCSATQDFIVLNAEIGKVPDEDALRGAASENILSRGYAASQIPPPNNFGLLSL